MKIKTLSGLFVIAAALSFGPAAFAKNFNEACPDLKTCLESVSAITGDHYLMLDQELKMPKGFATANVEFTKENADFLLTNYLSMGQLARVPTGPQYYVVARMNDAKGMSTPKFHGNMTEDGNLPNTNDLITYIYQASHPESVKIGENVIRTYANMGARIYGVEHSGQLIITDVTSNIRALLPILRGIDVAVPPATLKKIEERAKRAHEETMALQEQNKNKNASSAAPEKTSTPAPR
jgi:type II secretory pathway component GspD/PulD (secretin)